MAIREELTLGLSGWQANLDKARNDVRRFGAEIRQMGVEARSARVSASGGAGGGGVIGGMIGPVQALLPAVTALGAFRLGIDAISTSMERQRAEMALGAVSTEGVSDQLERLAELAEAPGLGFDQVVAGSTRLQAIGMSAEAAEKTLQEFGNALALVGGGKEQMDGIILALTQISAKGKVSAEEINQIAERLPQIRTLMKDAFGTADTEALQKMGIGADEFIAAIVEAASKFERASETSSAAMSNLQDDWKAFMQTVGDLVEPGMKPLFESLSSLLEKAKTTVKDTADLMAVGFAGILGVTTGRETLRALNNPEEAKGVAPEGPFKPHRQATMSDTVEGMKAEQAALKAAAEGVGQETPSQKAAKTKAAEDQAAELEKFAKAEAEADRDAALRREAAAAQKRAEQEQASEATAKEQERLTESVSRLSFEFASPDQQMKILRDRIQASLGVSGSRAEILSAADEAAAMGRLADAENGLQSLKELEEIAGRMPGTMATGAVGSFAGLMDQIFGRGTPEQQLDEMRRANTLAEDTSRTLDMILVKMAEPPTVNLFGED